MTDFYADTADDYAAALANPASAVHEPGLSEVSARMIAQVERELATLMAADRAADRAADDAADRAADDAADRAADAAADAVQAAPRTPAVRPGDGSTVVFSVRLDPKELDALHRRAAALGVRPSVLARNLIRTGVQPALRSGELEQAVERLEAAVAPILDVLGPMEAALAGVGTALAAVRGAGPAH